MNTAIVSIRYPLPRACVLLFAFAASCSSVDWLEVPEGLTDRWRDRELFVTEDFDVFASGSSAAADVVERVRAARERIRDLTALRDERGLLLAIDEDDAALVGGDFDDALAATAAWHTTATGATIATRKFRRRRPRPGSRQRAEPEIDPSIMLRAMPYAIPMDAKHLALPPDVLARVSWVAVLPTDGVLSAAVEHMIEKGLEKADLSFWKRMLMAPFMPMLRSRAFDEIASQAERPILDVLMREASNEEKARVLEALNEELRAARARFREQAKGAREQFDKLPARTGAKASARDSEDRGDRRDETRL